MAQTIATHHANNGGKKCAFLKCRQMFFSCSSFFYFILEKLFWVVMKNERGFGCFVEEMNISRRLF